MPDRNTLLRNLPSVDEVLKDERIERLITHYPRMLVVDVIHQVLDDTREYIRLATDAVLQEASVDKAGIISDVEIKTTKQGAPSLKRVVNATGIVLHTNLGRSLLSDTAAESVGLAARFYTNLEFDVPSNKRGSRHAHVEYLLTRLTGAEAAMAVNNNAGAVVLALSALAKGKEVIVSRGQLVEIGGSFRIPDVMKAGGAKLVEVGTTNKTHIDDFKNAITSKTALLMRVHPSNFRVVGFTSEVTLPEMVKLGQEKGLPVLDDLGSGVMVDLSPFGIMGEPTVAEAVASGADLVTFSGDKLLGGPQAGIIVGKKEYIDKLKKHPLARALRLDKLCIAGLEETLRIYRDPEKAINAIPTLAMLTIPIEELRQRAELLAAMIGLMGEGNLEVSVEEDISRAGGGALPMLDLPTAVVAVKPTTMSVNALEEGLRQQDMPVLARIKEDRLLFDPRTIQFREDEMILSALAKVVSSS